MVCVCAGGRACLPPASCLCVCVEPARSAQARWVAPPLHTGSVWQRTACHRKLTNRSPCGAAKADSLVEGQAGEGGGSRAVRRVQDRRGSSGQLLVTLRVNNDLACDLAALVALDDSALRPGAAGAATAQGQHLRNNLGRRRRRRRRLQKAHTVDQRQLSEDDPEDMQQPPGGSHSSPMGLGASGAAGGPMATAASRFRARRLTQSDGRQPRAAGLSGEPEPAETPGAAVEGETPTPPEPEFQRRFLRYKNVPGLAIG